MFGPILVPSVVFISSVVIEPFTLFHCSFVFFFLFFFFGGGGGGGGGFWDVSLMG